MTKGNEISRHSLVVIALIASVGLVLSLLLIIPYLTMSRSQESDSQCMMISFEGTDLGYVKAGDLSPNSFVWVYNPFDPVVTSEL